MKRKFLYIIMAVLLVVNLTAFATFTYHRCCGKPESCRYVQPKNEGTFLCKELSLTDAQIAEMKNESDAFHSQADSINTSLNAKRTELINLLMQANPDTGKINQQVDEVNSLQAALQKQVIFYLLQRKEIMTPEQQKKFFAILKSRFKCEANCQG